VGELWTFSVKVRDWDRSGYDFEKMNVSLWFNLTGDWELTNSTICDGPGCAGETPISFQHTFGCGNIGDKQFKFNVTDFWDLNNTTSSNAFTIQRDNVNIEFDSDPLNIDREGDTTGQFVYRINDIDNNSYVTNTSTIAMFYFSYD